jgi:hypothetical protein
MGKVIIKKGRNQNAEVRIDAKRYRYERQSQRMCPYYGK